MNHKYMVVFFNIVKTPLPLPIGSVGLGHIPFDIMFLTKQMGNLKLEVHENTTLKSAMQGPALKIAAGNRIVKNLKNSQKS